MVIQQTLFIEKLLGWDAALYTPLTCHCSGNEPVVTPEETIDEWTRENGEKWAYTKSDTGFIVLVYSLIIYYIFITFMTSQEIFMFSMSNDLKLSVTKYSGTSI